MVPWITRTWVWNTHNSNEATEFQPDKGFYLLFMWVHACPSTCQSDLVTDNQTQEYHQGLPEKDGKENPGFSTKNRISNTQLQEWSMLKSAAQASRSKWKWAGHFARLNHTRWAQATTMWDPYIEGPHWSRVARDRNEWKVLENQLNAVNHSRRLAQRMSL